MKSVIAEKMELKYEPVTLLLSNEKPEGARQFKPDKWGCVMFRLVAAVRGQTVAFDRKTYGCQGGGVGLGFGNQYEAFPGGVDGFCYFLSVGNKEWETGHQVAKQVKPYLTADAYDDFVQGKRYIEDPDTRHICKRLVGICKENNIDELVIFKAPSKSPYLCSYPSRQKGFKKPPPIGGNLKTRTFT